MKIFLPSPEALPAGFRYPETYLRMAREDQLPDLLPWTFLGKKPDSVEFYIKAMRHMHSQHALVPFARFEDSANGDLACFDGADQSGDPKIYFYVYESQKPLPPWEERYHLKDFVEWLRVAREESEEYQRIMSKDD